MAGKFIVFEGIDGSGTSTQATLLRDRLITTGQRAVLTSEPSEGPIGTMIRQAMKGRVLFSQEAARFDRQMAYLFAADRFDHLHNPVDGVEKLVSEGTFVISTRYYFSSFAYHGDSAADFERVRSLNAEFRHPDLVIYLSNTVERSMARISSRKHFDAYENAAKLTKVSENYERIFADYQYPFLRLNASDSMESLHEAIYLRVKDLL
ncbi:dTMP kinase [Paraburkholderia sabiae]|uniref:Thymidylate kinase n=1 Tax=Paraburkholderia sabiae TaxID=273251 RepID=A0ABU9QPR8_9BURK|nr:dTMP kinase [Paraburkholderia sabiae]WJZ77242.1 dTMP kinase [Paraburkholderia sabiae]